MTAEAVRQKEDTKIYTTRTTCRMCAGTELTKVWSFGPTPLANAYLRPEEAGKREEPTAPLDVYYCSSCHLAQMLDVVSPHAMFDHYLYVSSTSPTFVKHFEDYAATLKERFKLDEKSLVVDVGSNDGVLLKPLQEAGMKVLGIDPAKNVAQMATEAGIETWAEYFTPEVARKVKAKMGPAKIISANNVFAHTDNVDVFVEGVKELLTDDGVYVFEAQYLLDLMAKNLFDIVYHEHVCYYSVHPLIPFFQKHDIEVFDVERPSVHGGSLRVYIQKQGGGHEKTERLEQVLKEEKEQGLDTLSPYQEFSDRIAGNKEKLQDMLAEIKAEDKRIVGYGAPAKATTLMYALGLNKDTIEYIVDDAEMKQGMLMPGTHVPIVSADRLYDDKPDYCLILAWNFAEPIMKNHQKYVEQGGKFIVPVPEPKVL